MRPTPAWLAVTVPIVLVGGFFLIRTIGGLIQTTRKSVVLTVRMDPVQTVSFPGPGPLDLYLEGPRGANLSGFDFEIISDQGQHVPLRHAMVRTSVSGVSRVRLQVRSFDLERAGKYQLRISGGTGLIKQENRVVFARPIGASILVHVLGLIGLSLLTIGALVGSILSLVRR